MIKMSEQEKWEKITKKLNHDYAFYHIWCSIRGDWGRDVIERLKRLLKILPFTTLIEKDEMREYLKQSIYDWAAGEVSDGRTIARDCYFCYFDMGNKFAEPYHVGWIQDEDECGFVHEDPLIDGVGHEEANEIYEIWEEKYAELLKEKMRNNGK
jgi:hypothetical protein